uniref:WAP domain-containing protein n=1 Tax=Phocoena sinus TaxID=42100 RepID=A0A8C9CT29_PHOSS
LEVRLVVVLVPSLIFTLWDSVFIDERRPGTCPQLTPGSSGTCVEMCRGDESCPLGQKCCSNGCGHVCQTAV